MSVETSPKKLRDNQEGLVSIIVSVLIMILLSLIVTAMSRNATREQKQAIDRQLNSEAFYAAEAGINDTVYYTHVKSDELPEKTNCDPYDPAVILTNKLDGATGGVEYSCILYDQHPPTLEYGSIDPDKSTLIPIESETGVRSLTFSWQAADQSKVDISGCSSFGSNTFSPYASWPSSCTPGMLRYELVSLRDLSRDGLINNTQVAYLVPRNTSVGGVRPYVSIPTGVQTGEIIEASCADTNTPRKCNFTLADIYLPANQKLYLRLRSIYNANTLSISGSDLSGGPVRFKNAQMVVDATGKASDILKRVQVRIPVVTPYPSTDFAVQSTNTLCKILQVYPPDHGSSADSTLCPLN